MSLKVIISVTQIAAETELFFNKLIISCMFLVIYQYHIFYFMYIITSRHALIMVLET